MITLGEDHILADNFKRLRRGRGGWLLAMIGHEKTDQQTTADTEFYSRLQNQVGRVSTLDPIPHRHIQKLRKRIRIFMNLLQRTVID